MTNLSLLSVVCLLIEGNNALLLPSQQPRRQFGSPSGTLSSPSRLSSTTNSEQPPRRVTIRARTASKGRIGNGSATLTKTKRKPKISRNSKNKSEGQEDSTSSASVAAAVAAAAKAKAQAEESKTAEAEEPPRYFTKKPNAHTASGAPWQHQEMMDHTILTKEEEIHYGRQVVRARELRLKIEELLEERRMEREVRRLEMEEMEMLHDEDESDIEGGEQKTPDLDYDFLSYELEHLSVYGYRANGDETMENGQLGGFDLDDELLIDHAQHRSLHASQLRNHQPQGNENFRSSTDGGPKRTGYRNGSSSVSSSNAQRNSYTPLLHIPLHQLTESDVVEDLGIAGGKSELMNVLLDGAYAREVLMRRNVKLVMSIAKNWMRNSFSTANANLRGNGGGGYGDGGTNKKKGDKGTLSFLSQMYEGSWDRPSLDEAVQEGMLGLARAVDKYDPERGLRFSTYATHWITSYVRVCFQRAVTGCLRVPSQLHDIKAAYNKIIKDHLHLGSDPPAKKNIAAQLGISEKRLRTAIRATGSLVSVDAPVMAASGGGSYKGSMAGGDGANSQELLILDTLKCAEPRPEDQVEISFLRQCLENAMATELTPYERDILRLRLGLDSGEGMTVRQIVEISGGSISMSDVRSAERRAFKKLRSPTSVHTHNLLAYLDMAGA
eukprot:CAMPEP_0183734574 /NCGR_PEP_ID=MMETSP0737-20130205/44195_1 /TAXON_ID=385413 /ORGANISM="Thalassiosira miniscula, Strain CCMP1093" /LENGTH=665 /DNA_ID=CAMNT_0025968087 /DNA_START=194 /DNA_END=2187 /DNA_ORIENTATION=-